MNLNRSAFFKCAVAGLVTTAALFATMSASAGVNWSVGVSVPGVVVTEPAPVYYGSAPIYVPPPPVYYQPAPPVYYRPAPPVYYRRPPPVYYGPPAPVYYEQGEHWRYRDHRGDRGERDD